MTAQPHDEAPKRVRLTTASMLKRFKSLLKMNWRSRASLNPKLMGWLRGTVGGGAFTHVVLDKLDDEGAEIAMRGGYEGDEGAVELEFNPTGRTANVLLSLITAEWSGYKVEKGRLRMIPVEFRSSENPPCLVLNMKDSTIELAPKKKRKKQESAGVSEQSSTDQQGAKTKQPEAVTSAKDQPVSEESADK